MRVNKFNKYMSTAALKDHSGQESSTAYSYVNVHDIVTTSGIGWDLDLSEYSSKLFLDKAFRLPRRLTNPSYGREDFDVALDTLSAGAPAVEDVWRITQRLPSDLSKLLSDDRNSEKENKRQNGSK